MYLLRGVVFQSAWGLLTRGASGPPPRSHRTSATVFARPTRARTSAKANLEARATAHTSAKESEAAVARAAAAAATAAHAVHVRKHEAAAAHGADGGVPSGRARKGVEAQLERIALLVEDVKVTTSDVTTSFLCYCVKRC